MNKKGSSGVPHQSGDAVMNRDGRLGPHFGMPVLCVLEQLLESGGGGEGGRQSIQCAVGLLAHKLLVLGRLQEQLKELQRPKDLWLVKGFDIIIWMLKELQRPQDLWLVKGSI
jgi:hypothetical protein